MFIPGIIITIATFPGILIHELAHMLVCRLLRVRVMKVCYFRFSNPHGYVIHERPSSVLADVAIGFGPLLINTLAGAVIALPGAMTARRLEIGTRLDYILLWLGISIAMHSFPSTGDAKSIWQGIWRSKSGFLARLIALPFVIVIYIGAMGSIIWLDLIYGVSVVMLFPDLIARLLR